MRTEVEFSVIGHGTDVGPDWAQKMLKVVEKEIRMRLGPEWRVELVAERQVSQAALDRLQAVRLAADAEEAAGVDLGADAGSMAERSAGAFRLLKEWGEGNGGQGGGS